MTDAVEQWRAYFESGRTFSVDADRSVTDAKMRANGVGIVVSAVLAALVLAGLAALAISDGGRTATYLTVGLLVVALVVVAVRLSMMRRRLRAYAEAGDPLVVVSAESVAFSGVPPILWSDVLGVLVTDLVDEYESARGFGGWLRRAAVRTGGSTVALAIGIQRADHYRDGAAGGLTHDLIVVTDTGMMGAYLDHALTVQLARQVVAAVRVAARLHGIGVIASGQAKDGVDAAARMLKGERIEPRP